MFRRLALTFALLAVSLTPAFAQTVDCSQSLQNKADVAPVGSVVDVPACTYHETVYIGHSVILDGHNQAVIDGDNTRDRWVWIGTSDVAIRNFTMRNAATSLQEGAIQTQFGVKNISITGNDLGNTQSGEQIGITGTTDSKIVNNQIHDAGQVGIGTYQNLRLTIQGNHIYHNNTAGVDPTFAAGGIKAVNDTDSQIVGNEVDHNAGPGIWCDIACNGEVISGNNVHDQGYNPIFYEISSNGQIFGNTVSASIPGPLNWGCIVVSSSGDTNVHDNTCVDASYLRAQLDNRSDIPPDAGHNVVLQNNTVVRPDPPQATSWWQYTDAGPLVPGQNGNVDSGNMVLQSLSTPTPVPTSTPVPTATPRPTIQPTRTPTPTVSCFVNVRINGFDRGYKPC